MHHKSLRFLSNYIPLTTKAGLATGQNYDNRSLIQESLFPWQAQLPAKHLIKDIVLLQWNFTPLKTNIKTFSLAS